MKIEQKHCDAMMNGLKCRFWDNAEDTKTIDKLRILDSQSEYPFESMKNIRYKNCEPIKIETYYKSREDIFKFLYLNNFKPDVNGNFWDKEGNVFRVDMWDYCGKSVSDRPFVYTYHPDWLEEREIDED